MKTSRTGKEVQEKKLLSLNDLVYPELSYRIVGCAFEVQKELGFGYKEEIYQRAMAKSLEKGKLKFETQVYYPVKFKGSIVGRNFFDFLVEKKIVVELKKNMNYSIAHIEQVLNYLKSSNLKLAILINFGRSGASFKRIVNIND